MAKKASETYQGWVITHDDGYWDAIRGEEELYSQSRADLIGAIDHYVSQSWRRPHGEGFDFAKTLKKEVRVGSIVLLIDDADFVWAAFQVREMSGSTLRFNRDDYHVMSSRISGDYGYFLNSESERSWHDSNNVVYEFSLFSRAYGVYQSPEKFAPALAQIRQLEQSYLEETMAARTRFAVALKLIEGN